MIPWLIGGAAVYVASKVIDNIDAEEGVDVSGDFSALTKDEKNQAIHILKEEGLPQKEIAKSFGISAPAVSQRLKRFSQISPSQALQTNEMDNIQRLIDLADAGFSSNSIALLLQESNLGITQTDIDSFIKVYKALQTQLTSFSEDQKNA